MTVLTEGGEEQQDIQDILKQGTPSTSLTSTTVSPLSRSQLDL